jgi:6-phosphogluconate dehydrogenase
MPGGPRQAYDIMEPILTSCAAQVTDGACTGYIGPIGSGNYVKMVHNGIEYGDMQLIAEVYDVMNRIIGMSNVDMSRQFARWNDGMLSSYLIEITAKILQKEDDVTGKGYVVDYILDRTGMKGTGRWTVQEAAEQSVAAPTITASLDSRYISGRKDERLAASKILKGPEEMPNVSKLQILEDLENALYCAKVCSYAQGISLIKAASDANGWDVDLSQCVKMWKGGCIIRAKLLDKIQNAFQNDPALQNLMVDPGFANELNQAQLSWRRIVTLCVASGIACPALSASLNYFDSYRRERLPANLTQAQRDFFGGHTYERIDKEGPFHCVWTKAHKAIGNLNERRAGEQSQL